MREYCKKIYEDYGKLELSSFYQLLRGFLSKDYDIESLVEKTEKKDYSKGVSKRILTGLAAEHYFKGKYNKISQFENFVLKDTTNMACGFDFKLSKDTDFFCVEVKGLSEKSGSISLTEKEFDMAKTYKDRFCLFVVMNFRENPYHEYFFDPLQSRLPFKRNERQITQVNYTTAI